MEIKMRSAGRYDLQLPELSTPAFSFVTHDAPWMALVHALLGKDAVSAPPPAMEESRIAGRCATSPTLGALAAALVAMLAGPHTLWLHALFPRLRHTALALGRSPHQGMRRGGASN